MTFLKILGSIVLGVVLWFISGLVCVGVGLSTEEPLFWEISLGIGITVAAVLTFYIIFAFLCEVLADFLPKDFGGVACSIIALVFYIAAVLCLEFIPITWIAVVVFLVFLFITIAFKRNPMGRIAEEWDADDSYDYDLYADDHYVSSGHHTSERFTNAWWVIQIIIYIVLPLLGRFGSGDEDIKWFFMLAPSIILIIGVIRSIVKRGHDEYYDQ